MLATSVTALPAGEGWSFEFKWDGIRALLDASGGRVRVHSRRGADITAGYPEIAALAADAGDVLLDGELVAFVDGRPSFQALQSRMHLRAAPELRRLAATTPVTYVVFDMLRGHGVELTARPFAERRATLERWAADRDGWTISPVFDDGAATEAAARSNGLEGVVAKRLGSRYRPGVRSPDWCKLRFLRSGQFVVVGWEAPSGTPSLPTSVVLGTARDGGWGYAGKVGSGLSEAQARTLLGLVHDADSCPLTAVPAPSPGRIVRWVQPQLVVEVDYADWTDDGLLRQPVLRALRPDVDPAEADPDA